MKLSGIVMVSLLWFAVPASAQDHRVAHPPPTAEESTHYGWADVLRVDPVYDEALSEAPPVRSDCFEDISPPPAPPAPEHPDSRAGGTVIGALVGGVVGSMFGHGNGRKATIAAGGVAGGVVGNNVAAENDAREAEAVAASEIDNAPAAAGQPRCADPKDNRDQHRIVGYDVEYRYRGEIYLARLAYDPGDHLRVRVSVTPAD